MNHGEAIVVAAPLASAARPRQLFWKRLLPKAATAKEATNKSSSPRQLRGVLAPHILPAAASQPSPSSPSRPNRSDRSAVARPLVEDDTLHPGLDSDNAERTLQRWRKALNEFAQAYRAMDLGSYMASVPARIQTIRRRKLKTLLEGNIVASNTASRSSLGWSSNSVTSLARDDSTQQLLSHVQSGGSLSLASPRFRLTTISPEPDVEEVGYCANRFSLKKSATEFLDHSHSMGFLGKANSPTASSPVMNTARTRAMIHENSLAQSRTKFQMESSPSSQPRAWEFLTEGEWESSDGSPDMKSTKLYKGGSSLGPLILSGGKPMKSASGQRRHAKKQKLEQRVRKLPVLKVNSTVVFQDDEEDDWWQPDSRNFSKSSADTGEIGRATIGQKALPQWGSSANKETKVLNYFEEKDRKEDLRLKQNRDAEFRSLVNFAMTYNAPLDELKMARDQFAVYDTNRKGEISKEEFQSIVRTRCNLPSDKSVPTHLMKNLTWTRSLDKGAPVVSFEAYLLWSIHCAYCEELLVPDAYNRHIRQLARDQGMLLPDVEKVKEVFDGFDKDGSGEIEEGEFKDILCVLMKVKSESDVSATKLQRYWRELDSDGSGAVGFEEFLIWYATLFLYSEDQ